ncbi:MAG: hypothetical protein JWO83_2823 [Caulobacteraceae bacterium]|nr:hypothetical protein [Caulobacteraceae bacterium]
MTQTEEKLYIHLPVALSTRATEAVTALLDPRQRVLQYATIWDHPSARRNRIRDNVWDVINHEIEDLGLTPDWSRWTEDGFPPDTRNPRHDWASMWRPDPERAEARRLARAEALADQPPGSRPPDPHRRE